MYLKAVKHAFDMIKRDSVVFPTTRNIDAEECCERSQIIHMKMLCKIIGDVLTLLKFRSNNQNIIDVNIDNGEVFW